MAEGWNLGVGHKTHNQRSRAGPLVATGVVAFFDKIACLEISHRFNHFGW
tara:strand:- start:279 stop:428 length:150 start_codon:yes stop_codon:yes gene_type:complete